MATAATNVRIEAIVKGLDQVEGLKNSVKRLQATISPASGDLDKLRQAANTLGNAVSKTESDLRTTIAVLRDVRSNVALNSVEFKKLTSDIGTYERQLNKLNTTQGRFGKLQRVGQTAGAIAASGVFGGPEGLIGSAIGAIGGAGGALAGGAIGAQVGALRQQAGQVADYVKDLNLAKVTLAQASTSQKEYNQLLVTARQISADYSVGLKDTISGYAQIAVAARANNLSLSQTESVYRGAIAAGVAFGKSQEDFSAIVTATVQVLSKGKLSAEELQGQIGERLPGAVARFAEATGRSLPQLAKDLQDGKVAIADFVKFTEKNVQDYDEIAKIIGASPEKAGERLKLALDTAAENYGGFFQVIGAGFQNNATQTVSWFNQNQEVLKRWVYLFYISGKAVASWAENIGGYLNYVKASLKTFFEISIPGFTTLVRLVKLLPSSSNNNAFKKATDNYEELFPAFKPLPDMFGKGKPGTGDLPSLADVASGSGKDNAAKKAEQQAAKEEQLALQTAEAQRRLANQLFQYQIELDRKRYELQQRLNDLQTENQINSLTGVAKEYASMQQQMSNKIRDFYRESEQAAQKVLLAEQQLRSAQSVQTIAGSGSGSSAAGFTATQLQAASREAGKFTGIANMCAEAVKAFYKSLGITLPGVTAWADTVRKAGQTMTDWSQLQPGDIVATGRPGDTPHVGVYTGGNNVFHQSRSRGLTAGNYPDLDYFRRQGGYFVRPNTAPMGGNRALLKANAAVGTEAIDLQSARETLKLYQEFQNPTAQQLINSGVIANTQAIRDRLAALKEESAITQISNRLKLEGARPELIEQETSLKKLDLDQTQRLAEATSRLTALKEKYAGFKDKNTADALTTNADIQIQEQTLASLPELYQQTAQSIRDATAAQIAFNDAMRFRQDMQIGLGLQEGAQKYVESIGTMRDATAQLAQNGIKGLEDQLVSLVTTGTANFREFASSILKDTARMIIQQLVLRNVMQLIGALTPGGGGGGGTLSTVADNLIANPFGAANGAVFGNGLQAFAKGGIVNKPTMFRYASGGTFQTGLMGEAGPEAIVPLRRGRDGKLGIAGGGGQTSVVVNVDAKGTNVQGDNGKGEGLGKVLAAAVQQELIRQRRPGGLLAA